MNSGYGSQGQAGAKASLMGMTHAGLQNRLLRRSSVEAVLNHHAKPGVSPTASNDGILALYNECVGLFVRLKVRPSV